MGAQEAVQHNVDSLLDLFHKVREQKNREATYFRTWVDPETGELRFVEGGKRGALRGRRWQEISATITYDAEADRLSWQEKNPSGIDFSPAAFKIFQETICALKKASIDIKLADYLIINKLWHPSTRYQAEELLLSHPIGTFFFRKDPYTLLLQEQLLEQFPRQELSLWTISVLKADRLCSDYTVVHTERGWQFYNDDIALEQECFASLEQLLGYHKHIFRYPLYR